MPARKLMPMLACALLGVAAHGQVTSLPPVCFGINQNSPWSQFGPSFPVSSPGGLTVWFSAPMSTTIEVIDLPFTFSWGGPGTIVDLYVAPGIGVPPVTPSLATFVPWDLGGWVPFKTATPAPVTQGGSYALTLTTALPPGTPAGCSGVLYDPNAPLAVPYLLNTAPCQPIPTPPSGTMGFIARFRGSPCGPGPLAGTTVVGTHCGITITGGNTLTAGYPALGSNWWVGTTGGSGDTAYLFWSFGTNAAGSLIAPGSSCLHYLDPQSLTTLWANGAEPLAQATFPPSPIPGWWIGLNWSFPLPSSAVYAGTVVGLQAVVVSQAGTIPLAPGVTAYVTNALHATLGYYYP
jgi:hypothetical protein